MSSTSGAPGPNGLPTAPTRTDRRQAPSLDVIATQTETQQDSRSSSSTNSPAPNEYEESDFFLGANDSQSSLGVPNLQDMQVSDDFEGKDKINRLPNELLISVFAKLSSPADHLHCMLTCKRWARNAVDQLWHRPSHTDIERHSKICQTLSLERPYFSYKDFVRRLNLAAISDRINDGSVMPLAACNRVERLTLTNCKGLTDSGLIALVHNNNHLLALDISCDEQITEASILAIAENCTRLQGLNISCCTRISNESLVKLAENCKYIKRLKLNECRQIGDEAILAFAEHCPNLLEIDLHQCRLIGNASVTALLSQGQALRELRLVFCELIDDSAFLSLPPGRTYEHLRVLDLTSCSQLTDRAVERIVDAAPRLRNLVLSKCRLITDTAVFAIARLAKSLHFLHLGHCNLITDEAVKRLVHCCTRIRYIDLGCCIHLTDESVTRLATLPKLKRIGLVKCGGITDESIFALAKANQRHRLRRDPQGNPLQNQYYSHSSLERVHLSYCTNLTLKGIIRLLNSCPRLTHLSLTGVQAFLREDLAAFCRDAPREFTDHQRSVFCVFSGQGVASLRRYLNTPTFADLHDPAPGHHAGRRHSVHGGPHAPGPTQQLQAALDASFDTEEPDAVDDDDGMEDATDVALDPPAAPGQLWLPGGVFPNLPVHPNPPVQQAANTFTIPQLPTTNLEAALAGPPVTAGVNSASTAHVGHAQPGQQHAPPGHRVASGTAAIGLGPGPSTASVYGNGGHSPTPGEAPTNEGPSSASSAGSPA